MLYKHKLKTVYSNSISERELSNKWELNFASLAKMYSDDTQTANYIYMICILMYFY